MHIVVIGAGPSGLGAARHASEFIRNYPDGQLTVIERSNAVGGIWNGQDSPVYRDLHTNLPKEVMAFPDFQFDDSDDSFVHHSEVTTYLQKYCQHFDLKQFIKFKTEVRNVSPDSPGNPFTKWNVKIENLDTNEESAILADILMLTGVREEKPRVPKYSKNFTGDQFHSSQYRHPEGDCFRDKDVLVVGGSLSGVDISLDISTTARRVIISAERGFVPSKNLFTGNIVQMGAIKRIEGNYIFFSENDEEKTNIDTIIWCTGYEKGMKFLSQDCGLQVLHDGYVVDPLYLHLINIKYPSMAVLHIVTGNVPFPQTHQQVKCFLNLHKTKTMPSQNEMLKWLQEDIEWRSRLNLPPRHRHKMSDGRSMFHWSNYMDKLAEVGHIEKLPNIYGKMFNYTMALFAIQGLGGMKKAKFKVNPTQTQFSVSPNKLSVNIVYWLMNMLLYMGWLQ